MRTENFFYNDYKIKENNEKIIFEYDFEIENVAKFNPRYEIFKKDFKWKKLDSNVVKNLVFNLGMVEAISYYKAVCSKEFYIKCGFLDEAQSKWFRKLYYLGLGEFRYRNDLDISEEDFVEFISLGDPLKLENEIVSDILSNGVFIPVGGGKDSNVTMELLKGKFENINPFLINGKDVSYKCIETAGFSNEEIVEVNRVLDKKIIDLNNQGYLNGHTPFSAMVAFLSYTVAFLKGTRYIALSNENSANESNVEGEEINHQYSKTFEFENDFRWYCKNYLKAGNTEYFSFLRPISELQIAKLFSKYKKYHPIFRSCNVGSKKTPWVWCGNCPKCLFVYTILSPFLERDELIKIFGEDLFNKESLKETFLELCGFEKIKPFECVGTFSEVRFCVYYTTKKYIDEEIELPYLLKEYYESPELREFVEKNKEELDENRLYNFSDENNLPEKFLKILRENI